MIVQEITSLKDGRIQLAKELSTLKGRIANNKCLIEGEEAIEWAIDNGIAIDFILVIKSDKEYATKHPGIETFHVSDGLLKKVTGTKYLISYVAVGNIAEAAEVPEFAVVLDDLKDFGNIGTIVRTCHAFGIKSIFSTRKDIDLFQRKTVDASRGKVYTTNHVTFNDPLDTIAYLKKNNYQIVTTSPYGDKIQSLIELSDRPVALIVGNETNGVSDEFLKQADITVQIPMQSEVESLNVGVATGISIYELKLKQVLGMIEKKIKSTLGRDINVVAGLVREALDKELKKVSELSSAQLVFLMVLKCDTVMSVVDAQRQFGIPDQDMDSFFNDLIAKKYIATDGTGNYIMTETGVEIIGKYWAVIENAESKMLQDFTQTERAELRRLLNKMKQNCVNLISEAEN